MDAIEPFIGEIGVTAFTFAPVGWALCDGQQVLISQNSALFSVLGVAYGGDGVTTFGLPDLRGRVPIGQGAGAGLTPYSIGTATGSETVTLSAAQMPSHTHYAQAGYAADRAAPSGALLAPAPSRAFRPGGGTFTLATLGVAGGSQAHENRQPYLAMNYVICMEGVYPSRS